jgi:uncharacterized membrane protein
MKTLKKKIVSALAVATITVSAAFMAPVTANATGNPAKLDKGDFTQACKTQYGQAGWVAHLMGSTAYDWKCVYNNNFSNQKSVSVNQYCMQIWGVWAAAPVVSDPYSWKCQGY